MAKAQRKELTFGGLSNNLSETVESSANCWSCLNTTYDKGILEGMRRYKQIGRRPGYTASDVGLGHGYGKSSGNETQRLTITGLPTGGYTILSFVSSVPSGSSLTFTTASHLAYNATADDVYQYLQTMKNGTTYCFLPGDVVVTQGPFPTAYIEIDFVGRYANTDVALITNVDSYSGGSTPLMTITEVAKGGTSEAFYEVVQPSGSGDATLYEVTSADGFDTTTWTTIATDLDPTQWYMEQYGRKMYLTNAIDGLRSLTIGSAVVTGGAKPSAPTKAPTFTYIVGAVGDNFTGKTVTVTGPSSSSVSYVYGGGFAIKNTGTAIAAGTLCTATIDMGSDQDWGHCDFWSGYVAGYLSNTNPVYYQPKSLKISLTSSTPVNTVPDYNFWFDNGFADVTRVDESVQFTTQARAERAKTRKIVFSFIVNAWATNMSVNFDVNARGKVWLNDVLPLPGFVTPGPSSYKQDKIQYAYSYYNATALTESDLSPIGTTEKIPAAPEGGWEQLTLNGSAELTTSDRIFVYRKMKSDQTWRRLPVDGANLSTFGAANVTSGTTTFIDKWMEEELKDFPEQSTIGFPVDNEGKTASGPICNWKQCLCIASGKLVYISWVGQPNKFEPSPSTPNYVSPDPQEFPDVGVTEYLADNRAEDVKNIVGQDSLYAATNLSLYAKIGDTPAGSTVFRRLPGSRGSLGYRAAYRYGGGMLLGSGDGLWYYSVGRTFSAAESNGSLVEREETGGSLQNGIVGVRRSYQRLLSAVQQITFTGTITSGTFTLTLNGETTAPISFDASALDIQNALGLLYSVNKGDIEVFGGDLPEGTLYVRFLGQFAQKSVTTMTAHSSLVGENAAISISTISPANNSNLIVVEFNDEYWVINGRLYLHQSRSRKWTEGILTDSVNAVVANRERGLVFQSSTGRLMKFEEGLTTDATETVYWMHESPWFTGSRSRILGVTAICNGTPRLRILSDDGAGGTKTKDIVFDAKRFTSLNAASLPGVRQKVIFSGIVGQDSVEKIALSVQGDGDEWGS